MPPQTPPKAPLKPIVSQAPGSPCPCGSGQLLGDCCLPYLEGKRPAPTAEALMRSRYSAHVLSAIDYLWDTWDSQARRRSSKAEIGAWASSCEWLGLSIIACHQGGADDTQGLVSFSARFRQHGQEHEHRELSLFRRTPEGWRYVDHA